MKRRDFLQQLSLASALMVSPLPLLARTQEDRILILVELKGGNDGLNTLVPFTNPEYHKLRPSLGLKKENILDINGQLGLHPSLSFTHKLFKSSQMALIQGVGYQDPNLSHFRSIDIWETASSSDQFSDTGWIQNLVSKLGNGKELAKGVIIGDSSFGPFRGVSDNVLVMDNPKRFLKKKTNLKKYQLVEGKESLNHILTIENSISRVFEELKKTANPTKIPNLDDLLPKDKSAAAIKALFSILGGGHYVPIFKISIGGFDTHINQLATQKRLLKALDDTFHSLHKGLKELCLWDKSLVMTYSEFGRRARENNSKGTDHGTANVHFAMGGKVKGGLYGKYPSLTDLDDDGNLKYQVDFRSLYAELSKKWLDSGETELVKNWLKSSPGFLS